ncbi:MAG: hypothetical protein ABTQ25_18995 [Nitrosomonas ureae]
MTADNLRLFLELSSKLIEEAEDAKAILYKREYEFFASDCGKPVWCHLYELPILQHALQGVDFLGGENAIQRLAGSENKIIEACVLVKEADAEIDAWNPTPDEKEELRPVLAAVYALSFSLTNSFRALMTFGLYLNDLIAIVRNGGPDAGKALLQAVKIDPTVIGCQSAITYISQRTLLGDTKFLGKLGAAMKGKLSDSEKNHFEKVRLVLQVLHETGAKRLSGPDLYQLFVQELALVEGDEHSNSDTGNVENNLRQFAYQFLKKKAVSQPA